jgi:hypothetical protein
MRGDVVEEEMGLRTEINLQFLQSDVEFHEDIVVEVGVLDFLESGDVFRVELLVVSLPLESRADLLDTVLEFQEDG